MLGLYLVMKSPWARPLLPSSIAERLKRGEKIIADEDQMIDISDEEIEPADELISQTMPALYQAIVDHNIETV